MTEVLGIGPSMDGLLASLYDADLVLLSMRRSLPVTQRDHLERGHTHHPFS